MICQKDLVHGPSLADFFSRGPSNVAQDWPVQCMNCSGSLCPAALFSKCCMVLCGNTVGDKLISIFFKFNHVTDYICCQGNTFRRVRWNRPLLSDYWYIDDMHRDTFYVSPIIEERSPCTGTSIWGHIPCCGHLLWVTCNRKIKQLTKVQRAATSHIIHIYYCRPLHGYIFPYS